MKLLSLTLGLVVALIGCAADSSQDFDYAKGFNPPAPRDGYHRYATAKVTVQPGENITYCEWIDVAPGTDVDIVDIQGFQSVTGHHAVLYSSSFNYAVGENHECTVGDMVSIEFLGGIGGEGAMNPITLPDGYTFRQKQGRALMANLHYLNTTDSPQEVQSVLDVKTASPQVAHKAVGMAVINYLDFMIPASPETYTINASCTWPTDTSLFLWSNHMHEHGKSISAKFTKSDGADSMLANDVSWAPENAFNPVWSQWDVRTPTLIHAGDKVHISCSWNNTTGSPMMFPDEMCDGVGFYTESSETKICDATAD